MIYWIVNRRDLVAQRVTADAERSESERFVFVEADSVQAAIDLAKLVYWNLYLQEFSANHYRIIMPNRDGLFHGITLSRNGYAVQWPTNPHNTGEMEIVRLLNGFVKFANATFS